LVTVPGRVGDEPNQPRYYPLELEPGVWRIEGVLSPNVDCGVDRLPDGVVPLIEGTAGPFFEVQDTPATIEFYCFNRVWDPHEGGVSASPYDLRDRAR
jgi:hypothetical protein